MHVDPMLAFNLGPACSVRPSNSSFSPGEQSETAYTLEDFDEVAPRLAANHEQFSRYVREARLARIDHASLTQRSEAARERLGV